MYTTFVSVLRRVAGYDAASYLLWLAPLGALLALLFLTNPSWRRIERAAAEGRSRIGLLVLLLAGAFRFAVMGAVVAALAAALMVQEGLFSEKHGRVTERNHEAVRTKWGVAHHQRDLEVRQYAMREVLQEENAQGNVRERLLDNWRVPQASEDTTTLDEQSIPDPPNVDPEKLNPRRIVRRTRLLRRELMPGDSIRRSEVTLDLTNSPRRLGGAVYAGYEDAWRFTYHVRNTTGKATQAVMRFPLPADGRGVFDRLSLTLDGEDWLPKAWLSQGALEVRLAMKPSETRAVGVQYNSRGLGHFRYRPGDLRERCLVTVNVHGIPAQRLNFPIGSMPPKEDLTRLSGSDYTLHWDLSRAVTNLDVGIIVPSAPQPGYHVAHLLGRAPVGLALLAAALFLTRWMLGRRLDLLPVALVLVAYYVAHALLANLNDLTPTFSHAFGLSMLPLGGAGVVFWWLLNGSRGRAVCSSALVLVFFVAYPLISLSGDATGTLTYLLYSALVVYVLALAALILRGGSLEQSVAD